jgi:hypothetical protein
MIGAFRQVRKTTWAQRGLFVEAAVALAVARFALIVLPFARAASFVRFPEDEAPGDIQRQARIAAVRRAVLAAARRVPWRAMCIEQGFAAQWMLRRRAIPAVLHYGVRMQEGDLKAHVWVRSGDSDIVGCENSLDFTEVAQFPDSR